MKTIFEEHCNGYTIEAVVFPLTTPVTDHFDDEFDDVQHLQACVDSGTMKFFDLVVRVKDGMTWKSSVHQKNCLYDTYEQVLTDEVGLYDELKNMLLERLQHITTV